MMSQLRAEARKLLTVRSTYVIIAICLVITLFSAFYVEGFRSSGTVTDPNKLINQVVGAATMLSVLIAFIGILLMTHEYRYGTILYTLASARNRLHVLAAKAIVVSLLALLLTALFCTLAPLLTYAGIRLAGAELAPQNLPSWSLVWRVLFFGWGYSMLGLLLATLIRNQVGTFAFLFIFPATFETLLGLLLREKVAYLPFTALQSVVQSLPASPFATGPQLSHGQAALVFLAYLVVGWIVAWLLFVRRDAT